MIPVAAQNQERILSIPIFPEMTGEMIDYVVQAIRRFFEQHRSAT
jgi:dTDP-4-amino-4,6-dideoxygalactose transaminase